LSCSRASEPRAQSVTEGRTGAPHRVSPASPTNPSRRPIRISKETAPGFKESPVLADTGALETPVVSLDR